MKFHSCNCGPCVPASRMQTELEKETPWDKAKFASVDVEKAPLLAQKYSEFYIPAVVLLCEGKHIVTELMPTKQRVLEMTL